LSIPRDQRSVHPFTVSGFQIVVSHGLLLVVMVQPNDEKGGNRDDDLAEIEERRETD
jgi:hypothetical protein